MYSDSFASSSGSRTRQVLAHISKGEVQTILIYILDTGPKERMTLHNLTTSSKLYDKSTTAGTAAGPEHPSNPPQG